jgi:LuxR family maltose regulon positive regulatory protein
LAGRLITGALQGQYILVALEALLLRAQMRAELGSSEADSAASRADYIRALELAEPEEVIGVFVEQGHPVVEALTNLIKQKRLETVTLGYVERILAAFPKADTARVEQSVPGFPDETGPAALAEPLTDRELEVLRSMAEGLKYKEIAAKLFISLNTVRYHVKAIYGKLDVNSRTQAIEAARQRRIL